MMATAPLTRFIKQDNKCREYELHLSKRLAAEDEDEDRAGTRRMRMYYSRSIPYTDTEAVYKNRMSFWKSCLIQLLVRDTQWRPARKSSIPAPSSPA